MIDGGRCTMTPGFIDVHALMMLQMPFGEGMTTDERYSACVATLTANTYITHGLTTVRDPAGLA